MVKQFIFNLFEDYLQGLRYLSSAECKGTRTSYLCNRNKESNTSFESLARTCNVSAHITFYCELRLHSLGNCKCTCISLVCTNLAIEKASPLQP